MELQSIAPAGKSYAPHRRVDTGFILEKKIRRNHRYFCCKLPPIAPDGRTDTFSFSTIINIDIKVLGKELRLSGSLIILDGKLSVYSKN